MNWIKNINAALAYIEEHLDQEIRAEDVSKQAYSSKYHFMRMFTILTDMNLFDYIRMRRLTVCVKDLSRERVIDVAYKYGYESPEAFSRAFKRFHGISPSKVKGYEGPLKVVLPLSIQVIMKGEEKMNYRIQKKEAFQVIGYKRRIVAKDGENFVTIPKFWKEMMEGGKSKALSDAAGPMGLMGIISNPDEAYESFDYYIAIEGDLLEGQEMTSMEVEASTWAIFQCIGPMPDAMQSVWKKIYSEWFPATQYEHAGTSELEVYYPGDASSQDYESEIWIPIKEKL